MTRYQTFGDGGEVDGFTEVEGGTLPVAGDAFATFDPRIDGLDADPGTIWRATDCPMQMLKVGTGNKDWIIAWQAQQSALVACRTAAQVNALYQGLARQPLLDFTPEALLKPTPASDEFVDEIGLQPLTKQGLGAGATIGKSPLFDNLSPVGYQAQQVHGNASYYAAANSAQYDVTTEAFCVGWVGSCTQNAEGGIPLSKGDWPLGHGYFVSYNAFGGFGFAIQGTLGNLNTDTPFGTPGVDDGKLRVFHMGRSVIPAAEFGYVRTYGIAPVVVNGDAGDISEAVSLFGLVAQGSGSRIAQSSQQVQKIVFWRGAAAENIAAHASAIEAGLQAQLGDVEQQLLKANPQGDFVPVTPARAFNAPFMISGTRPSWGFYSVNIECGGNSIGSVELRSDINNPPVTVRAEVQREIVAGAFADSITVELVYFCPPGEFIELATVVGAGAPVFTLVRQTEITL